MSVVGTYLIGEYRRRGIDIWYDIELKVYTGAAMFHLIYTSRNPVFDKLAENLGGTKLALTGQDARTYVDKNRSVAA